MLIPVHIFRRSDTFGRTKHRGFTLIELITAVVIISILATITTVGFSRQQAGARDRTRAARATLVASALEKYYEQHGEYPSPRALTNNYAGNTGTAVASRLAIKDETVLVMPKASSGTTNSLVPALSTDDTLAYSASSTDGDTNCQTTADGGCDKFTLSYKKEADGSTVTIDSIHQGRDASYETPLAAPTKPTLSAVQSGTALNATSSVPACATGAGYTPRYSFRVQVAAGAWGAWTAWQTGAVYTRSGNTNATAYSFQVMVRCESSANVGDSSVPSDPASLTYYTPPTAPATPSVTVSPAAGTVATSATGTASAVTCNIGTPQYAIDYRTNDGSWTAGSWGTGTTQTVSANQGTKYGFRARAQCVNGTQAAPSSVSAEVTVTTGITAPGAPSVSGSGPTWSWTSASCPTGTSPAYQYQFSYWNGSGWVAGSSWTWIGTTSVTNSAATSQGLQYGINVQQYCYSYISASSGYVNSGYSGTANGGTFWVPVTHVQVAAAGMRLNTWTTSTPGPAGTYSAFEVKSFTGSCASGLSRDVAILGRLNYDSYGYRYETRGSGGVGTATGWDTASYDNTVNGGSPENGVYGNHHYINSEPSGTYGYSKVIVGTTNVQLTAYARCRNKATGYWYDSSGNGYLPALYHYGIIYTIDSGGTGTFGISCRPQTYGTSYCSGGYGYNDTSVNSSGLNTCGTKAPGVFGTAATENSFSATTTNWSQTVSAGGGGIPTCWSTSYLSTTY